MTTQEKARAFMDFHRQGDRRCGLLLMMLAIAHQISEAEALQRINKLAEEGR